MPLALTITPALIVAIVLVVSGIAKLRTPDDEAGWAELGVPTVLRKQWLMRLHPIAELVLAAALLLLGGALGVLAAVAATLLFLVYLVMVWQARRRMPDASCACFGGRKPITGRTLLRNGWLVLLSVLAAFGLSAAPLLGGAVAIPSAWPWVLALAAVAVTFILIDQPDTVADAPALASAVDDDDLEDYVRTRTPAVPVLLGDGSSVNLRSLAAERPILLLAVSETCGSCTPVIESVPHWRELLPEVSVRMLLRTAPEQSTIVSTEEPQTLHDPDDYVRGSISDWPTPTAVLLGIDGMLAGGPITGSSEIEEFLADIYESLHGERPVL